MLAKENFAHYVNAMTLQSSAVVFAFGAKCISVSVHIEEYTTSLRTAYFLQRICTTEHWLPNGLSLQQESQQSAHVLLTKTNG